MGNAAAIASLIPLRPSAQIIRISFTRLDDAKSYHELGRITVPVAEGFVLTDNADPEHPDETYAASDLAKLAASERGFTTNNTLATIEHGELTVLARSYTP